MQLPQLIDASLSLTDRVALLTLQRDDVRNALTGTALVEDILLTLDWCNSNPAASVLVITGAGKAFSAGGNVKEMRDKEGIFAGTAQQITAKYRHGIQRLPLAMETAEIPVIAAINGPAIGAGMDLTSMCDLRLGCEHTLLGATFVNLGIIPGDGGAWFLQRLIGYQRTAELILTGRLVKAQEALELGLLLEVVESERLLPRTMELARTIAAKPPLATRKCKQLLKLGQAQELSELLAQSAIFQGTLHHSEDHLEAINAFLEKRPGNYNGR
jgi:enoyl-CoA hydratase/carnithine racemase